MDVVDKWEKSAKGRKEGRKEERKEIQQVGSSKTHNHSQIKEIELNPIVNRELARRVRTVSGAAVLKDLVKTDINMAKKLIQQLDEKFELWKNVEEEPLKKTEEKTTGEEKNEAEKPEVRSQIKFARCKF